MNHTTLRTGFFISLKFKVMLEKFKHFDFQHDFKFLVQSVAPNQLTTNAIFDIYIYISKCKLKMLDAKRREVLLLFLSMGKTETKGKALRNFSSV